MTTVAYAGVLAGPAGIGCVAHLTSLRAALRVAAVMLLVVAARARHVRMQDRTARRGQLEQPAISRRESIDSHVAMALGPVPGRGESLVR